MTSYLKRMWCFGSSEETRPKTDTTEKKNDKHKIKPTDDINSISAGISRLDIGHADDGSITLKTIARLIREGTCNNILVLSGAGVSVSAGIPDFRTPGTGLYDNLQKYNLPFAEAVFDLDFYQDNPKPFVALAPEIWPGVAKHSPTLTHSFLRLLSDKNLLLRNYTQNIDGLEVIAGVDPNRVVECHGHFRTAKCTNCGKTYSGDKCREEICAGVVPRCPRCEGYVKPDIVFFGEGLPERFHRLVHQDTGVADLLIVMGTSLKVAPVNSIPERVPRSTPRVLFNRELVGDFNKRGHFFGKDVFEEGNCDESVRKLCRYLGWENELEEMNALTRVG